MAKNSKNSDMLIENKMGKVGFVIDETICTKAGEVTMAGVQVDCIQKNLKDDYPKQLIAGNVIRRSADSVTPQLKTDAMIRWFDKNYGDEKKGNFRASQELFTIGTGMFGYYRPGYKSNFDYTSAKVPGISKTWEKLCAEEAEAEANFKSKRHQRLSLERGARANGSAVEIVPFDQLPYSVKFVQFVGENRKGWEFEETLSA